MGSPRTFAIAVGITVVWGISGFFVGFGDSWQLAMNSLSTVITTFCVLLVQNTQNRDSRAMQLKLNEIIRSTAEARNVVIALEDAEDSEAEELRKEFKQIRDEE